MTKLRETTEQMLSRLAAEREVREANALHITVEHLRYRRRMCKHPRWRQEGVVDICTVCGEGRA